MGVLQEMRRPKARDEQAEFVMEHVDRAIDRMSPFEDIWDEVEANFLVRSLNDQSVSNFTKYPFATEARNLRAIEDGSAILVDPETHQIVMSTVSGIILSIFPTMDFIRSRRRGVEDTFKSKTTNKLLQYSYRQEGEFLANVEWLLGAGIYGTGIGEEYWDYVEEPRDLREILVDPETGLEETRFQTLTVPVWDDPRFDAFDIRQFYPDTGQCTVSRMKGAAREFSITAQEALDMAERGIYRKSDVESAIDLAQMQDNRDRLNDEPTGLYPRKTSHPEFHDLVAIRYCGETPFRVESDAFTRREIVTLNGITVRSEVWTRRLPWFECKITPRLGSFYGISPGELVKDDQDFASTLKMMLADAVVRAVHPPHIYDHNAEVDVAKLRRFSPDVPIGADRTDAIQQVPYNPPVQPAFVMYQGVKQQMREGSSATDPNQGFGIGTKRLSASEAVGTFQRAGVRPEMFNRIMEQEFLPPRAKYRLGLYQHFLQEGTDDLALRVGESNAAVVLADIMEDFDIEFVGSRVEGSRDQDLQAFREIMAASANPIVAQITPWVPLLRNYFDKLGQYEISAMVGNEELMKLNILLGQLANFTQLGGGQNQGNNGEIGRTPPAGALPAQLLGGPGGIG